LAQNWKFEVYSYETSVTALKEENRMLKKELSECTVEKNATKTQLEKLQVQVQLASEKLKNQDSPSGVARGPQNPSGEYSDSHQRLLKRKRMRSCELSLAWLQREGYTPTKVELKCNKTGKKETIVLSEEECQTLTSSMDKPTQDDMDIVNMMLYAKDRFSVSGSAYHEMAQACREMPRHYKLKERIRELNKLWNICPTPNCVVGVQQALEDRLRVRICTLLQTAQPDAPFRIQQKVRVKLSGDGTWVGKRLHLVNFTFTLLEEGSAAHSHEGNHALAIFKTDEDYAGLNNALEDLVSEVERLKRIEVDGTFYSIEYYLGGDWKFLATVTGIDSASCMYACIWCKCSANDRWDMDKQWSISDPSHGARTIEENMQLASRPRSKKQYNVTHKPLFPSIPLTNVVIDNLHLFLRVSDVLFNRLVIELKRHDSLEKVKKLSSFDPMKYHHLDAFQKFVTSLGIPSFRFYVSQNSKLLKCRSLTGPEKLRLFRNISIANVLPKLAAEEVLRIQVLWTELVEINQYLSKPPEDITSSDIDKYAKLCRQWVVKFTDVYHTEAVTPYIHAMSQHAGEFVRIHGSLLPFTQHGLEKYNDITTKDYFRSTHHRGEQALLQIMQKQNRIEHLRDNSSAKRPKRHEVTCSVRK